MNLSELFIVSKVILGDEDEIKVDNAPGTKCPRCWIYTEAADENGLCPRCSSIINK